MDEDTNSYGCSENLTAMRTDWLQAADYMMDETDELEGVTAIWEGNSHIDEWGMNCFYTMQNDLNEAYWVSLITAPESIPLNLLYNLGFMWVDVVNFLFYTPITVPNENWGFFFFYLLGDFTFRFIVHDSTA